MSTTVPAAAGEVRAGARRDAAPERQPRPGRMTDRARKERNLGWLLAGPAFIVMLAVTAYPIANAVWYSLFDFRLTDPDGRSFVGLGNYMTILSDGLFWRQFGVTAAITVVTVAVEFVLGFALALVMHRALYLRKSVRTAILVPYGIITVVSAYAWQYAFTPAYGFVNPLFGSDLDWFGSTIPSLVVICLSEIWKTTPFMSLLLLAGLAQIPSTYIEAAKVDGANVFWRFRSVTLPMLSPIAFFLVVTSILSTFQSFDIIRIMTRGGPVDATNTLIYYIYEQGFIAFNAGRSAAAALIMFVLMMGVTLIQLKYSEAKVHYG